MEAIKVIILVVILGIAVYLKQGAEGMGSDELPACEVSVQGDVLEKHYRGWVYRKATDSTFCLESRKPGYFHTPFSSYDVEFNQDDHTLFFIDVLSDQVPPEEIKMHEHYE